MKKTRWISLLLAGALCVGLTGCIGNFYENVANVDGREISAGLYLNMQYDAFAEGKTLVEDSEKDPFKQTVEDQKFSDWLSARTEEKLREFVAIERLCAENEVVLSEENRSYLEQMASYWDMSAETFEKNGIGYDTLMLTLTNGMLKSELFKHLYAADSELAPPAEEIRKLYEEQFGQIEYVMLPYKTSGDTPQDKEAEVTAIAEEMKTRMENGEDYDTVAAEGLKQVYELLGREYTEDTASSALSTSYIEFAGGEDDEYYPPEFRTQLQSMEMGAYGVHKMGSLILVYRRVPNFADDTAYEEARDNVVTSLYEDDFDAYLKGIYDAYPVSWEPGARFYFSPKKIVSSS